MDIWNHTEFVYPFVPQEVLDRRAFGAGQPAEPVLRPEDRRAALRRGVRRVPALRRARPEHLHERASCRDQQSVRRQSGHHRRGGAATTKRAKILSLGTLVTVRRDPVRVAEEYATIDVLSGGRLQIGFVKSGGTEMASGDMPAALPQRAPMGGARPDREGADASRRAVQLGGRAFHPCAREHLAAPAAAAAPRFLDGDQRARQRRRARPARHRHGERLHGHRTAPSRRPTSTGKAWRETHAEPLPEHRLGYSAFFAVGDSDEEALRLVEKMQLVPFRQQARSRRNSTSSCRASSEDAPARRPGAIGGQPMDLSPQA